MASEASAILVYVNNAEIKRKEHKRRLHPAVQPGSRRELILDLAWAAADALTTELVKKD